MRRAPHVDREKRPASSAKHLPFGKFSVLQFGLVPGRSVCTSSIRPLPYPHFAMAKSADKKAEKKADKKAAKSPAKAAAAKEATPAKTKPISSKEILAKANVCCLEWFGSSCS